MNIYINDSAQRVRLIQCVPAQPETPLYCLIAEISDVPSVLLHGPRFRPEGPVEPSPGLRSRLAGPMPWEAVYKAKRALKGRQNLGPGGLLGRDADH
jgi:hypothetical protein